MESSAIYMYDRLVTEGHDARLLRFSPSADGTIPGSHQNPKNSNYWQVGCLGITEGKVQSADLTCDVIKKVAPLVLNKL